MKANIFEIKRFAVHDGNGVRTTIFFKGCPLHCVWCHNPEGIDSNPKLAYFHNKCISCGECVSVCPTGAHFFTGEKHNFSREKCVACAKCASVCLNSCLVFYGKEVSLTDVLPVLLKDKPFYDVSGGGVTLSGGECLLYDDFCAELLKRLKENDVNTAIDTCGYVNKNVLDKVIPCTDVFLYDVKAISKNTHILCTGKDNDLILDNLLYLDNKGSKIEVRIPFVPNLNSQEIPMIGKFLTKLNGLIKVRILPYHNFAGSKYLALGMKNTLPKNLPLNKELDKAYNTLKSYNLPVVKPI